jgi:large subunit ribosomal protein L33
MAPKIKSILIKLVSAAGTGYFYATKKNPTNVPHKLALMKVRRGRVGERLG